MKKIQNNLEQSNFHSVFHFGDAQSPYRISGAAGRSDHFILGGYGFFAKKTLFSK